MDNVETAFLRDTLIILKFSTDWEERLIKIKNKLEKNENNLKKLNGYNEVYKYLKQILPLMEMTKSKIGELEKLKSELEKNRRTL